MFWGLTQEQSGPCGVLATVQAYILQCLLFHNGMYGTLEMLQQSEMPEAVLRKLPEIYKNFVKLDHPDYPEEWIHIPALVEALCAILYNATPYSRYKIILFHPLKQNMTNPLYTIIYNTNYEYYELDNIAQVATLLLKHIDLLLAEMGVLSFTMSVLATREVENVKNDMDDPEMPLIGLYGHSSQELVNLMLQGKAVSNVFDGEKTLPGADQSVPYRLKGIEAKGNVGFLTEREATRHCQVGSFYKNPRFPVWVLGSYSHYTVLFAVDVNLSKLTEYEIQKDNILNVWACLDPDDNKFITMNLLSTLLEMLGVQRLYSDAKHALTNDSNILLQTTFMDWYLGRTFNNDMELNRPVTLFHYNGQDITRPLVRADLNKLPDDGIQIMYKTSDMKIDQTIDSNILGYAPPEALELAKTLWTRWPKTQVEVNNVEIE
uniref:Deubiquitinating enzyme MINDY-3/4 conserved domain-containing protein n=2 Tax=Babesia bovis TaxID=5865 RepID=A7APH8_BABBO|eukprot:XP_001612030.1 hypothetical protein [Babesia bovis T2Bo]